MARPIRTAVAWADLHMSVVDGELSVYRLKNLRIADASIMPRITTGNPMAACVFIGERAAEMLMIAHRT